MLSNFETIAAKTSSRDAELADLVTWLRTFEAGRGRPLRVLHVGNIANNAFLNAKFLRTVGIEAHVVCPDYTHVMATPEWEEVDLVHSHGNDFLPRFAKSDIRNYRRPYWFVSGPLVLCAQKIRRLGGESSSWLQRAVIFPFEQLIALANTSFGTTAGRGLQLAITEPRLLFYKLTRYLTLRLDGGPTHKLIRWLYRNINRGVFRAHNGSDHADLIDAFDKAFPERPDRLTGEDIAPFQVLSKYYRGMFRHYDIVQCYATDPLHALLTHKRPYVAFEHGTLRDFTQGDNPIHRLTALAYRQSDHAFVTNGDCQAYAERLGLPRYGPIIHPIDVDQHRDNFGNASIQLRSELEADVVLFCPLRHDWPVKGTDIHLRALPLIKSRTKGRVRLVLIRWGQQIDDSAALIEKLGCSNDVVWRPSMCRITMIKHIQAADAVLDQMALPHFGATAPQAIAAGTPVISSYVPENTSWIIPEPAPILPAFSPEEVADAVVRALDPDWRAIYKEHARYWTDTYHHPKNVILQHLSVYRRVLENDRQGG